MKLTSAIQVVCSALFCATVPFAYASQGNIAPSQCPSLSSISATAYDSAEKSPAFPGMYYVMQTNHPYGTENSWDFGILVKATNESEAFAHAKSELSLYTSPRAPKPTGYGTWICEYLNPNGPEAVAFTPAHSADIPG